jgi:hypothetical protein
MDIQFSRNMLLFLKIIKNIFLQSKFWFYIGIEIKKRLRWSRGSVLAFGTQVRGFKASRSRRIFQAKKSSALLPSEWK